MKLSIESLTLWLAAEPVDFRKSVDGLSAIVISEFEKDLHNSVYIFFNRNRNRLKMLGWHNNGFVLIYKRLEKGRFKVGCDKGLLSLSEDQVQWLLKGIDWQLMSEYQGPNFEEIC